MSFLLVFVFVIVFAVVFVFVFLIVFGGIDCSEGSWLVARF